MVAAANCRENAAGPPPISVSHETIYQFVYSADGRKEGLWEYLPERRARRRPRHARRRHGHRFPPELSILHRPDMIARRKQFGHWECDANVTSLVKRVSRFTVLLRNNDRQSRAVMDGVIGVLQPLPQIARRSITFDRGTEFTEWAYLQAGIGSKAWFCDPQYPWQKGTVGNTNRRTRRWLPRDLDPLTLSDRDLVFICHRLNNTPRRCLGYKTPAEIFRQKLVANRHRYE